jgi:hypothetical protein
MGSVRVSEPRVSKRSQTAPLGTGRFLTVAVLLGARQQALPRLGYRNPFSKREMQSELNIARRLRAAYGPERRAAGGHIGIVKVNVVHHVK